MIYIYSIICIILCVSCSTDTLIGLGVCNDNLSGAFSYQIAHISFVHLAINILSLCIMYKPVLNLYRLRIKDIPERRFFFLCYAVSILAGIIAAGGTPTIGASGIVFCLLGMLIMLNPTLNQLKSYIYVAAAIVLQFIFGKSNIALHLVAFAAGALCIIVGKYGAERRRLYQD